MMTIFEATSTIIQYPSLQQINILKLRSWKKWYGQTFRFILNIDGLNEENRLRRKFYMPSPTSYHQPKPTRKDRWMPSKKDQNRKWGLARPFWKTVDGRHLWKYHSYEHGLSYVFWSKVIYHIKSSCFLWRLAPDEGHRWRHYHELNNNSTIINEYINTSSIVNNDKKHMHYHTEYNTDIY